MGLFDKIFNRKKDPLSDISVGKRFGDYEDYVKKFTVALEDSYKDFLMTVASSIIGCRKGTDLYAILDIAKKVEAESVESKDPESEKKLSEYKEKSMMGRNDESVKIRALNRYQISLLKGKLHMFATAERYLDWNSGARTNSRNKIVADTILDDAKKICGRVFRLC